MLLNPLPGADRQGLVQALSDAAGDARTARVGNQSEVYMNYLNWSANAARDLSQYLPSSDIDALVLTRRYWALVGAGFSGLIVPLLNAELDERVRQLDSAVQFLGEEERLWRGGFLVVLDTNFDVHCPGNFED